MQNCPECGAASEKQPVAIDLEVYVCPECGRQWTDD